MKYSIPLTWLAAPLLMALAGCNHDSTEPTPRADAQPNSTHAGLLAEARRRGPRDCSKDFKFMAASQSLGSALEQIKLSDYRRANILLRDGLEAVGQVDLGTDVLDDSGQVLSLAWGYEWNGQLQSAARQRQVILTDRLADYAELNNLQRCPSAQEAVEMELPVPR